MKSLLPTIPPEVWRRSARPGTAMSIRLFAAGFVGLLGLFFGDPLIQWGFLGLAAVVFFAATPLADSRLGPMEREVDAVDRAGANDLLKALPERRVVRWFAPATWLNIQKAKLHLRRGDARAAAMALSEARQQNELGASRPELRSAEAEAHLQADDRKPALAILGELESAGGLRPFDAMNLGVLSLSDGRRSQAALGHLNEAEAMMGDHPRLWAGLALAQQKAGDLEAARTSLQRAEDLLEGDEDIVAKDLAKRAKKGLRQSKGKNKGSRKQGRANKRDKKRGRENKAQGEASKQASGAEASDVTSAKAEPAVPKAREKKAAKQKGPRKGSKKARKAARREERRKQRAAEREAKRVAGQREQVQKERDEAEKLQARVEADRKKGSAKSAPASAFPNKKLFSPALPPIGAPAKKAAAPVAKAVAKPAYKPAAKPAAKPTAPAAKPAPAKPAPAKPAPPAAASLFKPLALSKDAAAKATPIKAPAPAAKAPAPVAKPAAPVAKPAAPVAKPVAPVAKPAAPPVLAPPPMVSAPAVPSAPGAAPAPPLPDSWDDLFGDVPAAPVVPPKPKT